MKIIILLILIVPLILFCISYFYSSKPNSIFFDYNNKEIEIKENKNYSTIQFIQPTYSNDKLNLSNFNELSFIQYNIKFASGETFIDTWGVFMKSIL